MFSQDDPHSYDVVGGMSTIAERLGTFHRDVHMMGLAGVLSCRCDGDGCDGFTREWPYFEQMYARSARRYCPRDPFRYPTFISGQFLVRKQVRA